MISVVLNILLSDSSEIPSLWEMQSSLLNDSSEDVLVPLCQSLLISALEDPGCEGPNVSIGISKKSAFCFPLRCPKVDELERRNIQFCSKRNCFIMLFNS